MPTSGVKVLTIGKSFLLPYEVKHVDDSAQILGAIAVFRPDVIVTSTFIPGSLNGASFDIRKRWINVDPAAGVEAIQAAIENCYYGNLWGEHPNQKLLPLISIYTGTYNTGDYLREAYNSIKEQTYQNWEWVVVDDQSSDGTWDRLEALAREDIRVRPFRSGKRLEKIGAVKDTATRLCRGIYLVELDHDDMLTDSALEEIKKAFDRDPEVGFVYSSCSNFFEGGGFQKFNDEFWSGRYHEEEYRGKTWEVCEQPDIYGRFGDHFTQSFAYFLTVGPNHVRAFRTKTLFELGGYNPQLPIADDWDLYARMFLRSKCVLIDKLLYLYRLKDNWSNTTFTRNKAIQDHLALGRSHYAKEFEEVNRRLLAAAAPAPVVAPGVDKPCFVMASRTAETATKIQARLGGQDVFVKVGAKSILEAYEEGRLHWKGRRRIIYVHDDVIFNDLPKLLAQVEKLPSGLHGPCGSQSKDAREKACWWDEKPLAGAYVQHFKDGTAPKAVRFQNAAAEVSWLDGFCLISVDQTWSWKVAENPAAWHGYDWLACKRTNLAGGKCFTLEQDEPLLGHEGYMRTEGLAETLELLRVLSKTDQECKGSPQIHEPLPQVESVINAPGDVSRVGFVVLEAVPSELTVRCLESIRQWAPGAEIVLLANGCEPLGRAVKLADKVVRLDINLGFAAGCNRGAMEVTRPLICLMNNDAVFVDDTPARLVGSMGDQPLIVAPYSNKAKPPQGDVAYAEVPTADAYPSMVVGLCMMLPTEFYRTLGGFDPRLLTWEDDDFCAKAMAWGVKSKVVGGTWVEHERHATFKALGLDVNKVMAENQEIYKKKNPVIRAIVIAKDEEKAIAGFFAQLLPITRDWCVLDTGSTDGTIAMAKRLGAKVEQASFKDFASARNEALNRFSAGADWIIMFDPDERLDGNTILNLKELVFRTPFDIFLAPLKATYPDGSKRDFVSKPFLFRNKPEIRWAFKVHEKLIGSSKQALVRNGHIEHVIALHEDGRRQKVEGFYSSLMAQEPYFTDPAYKRKMLASWPILDYEHTEDARIKDIHVGPLISVVIPTFKRAELLKRAVASVLAQDYGNVEVVIVGDACPELWASNLPADPRIRVLNLKTNYGEGGAVPRNHAIMSAAGPLIAYLDDDNVWKSDHLSTLYAALRTANSAFAFSSMEVDGVDMKFAEPLEGYIDTSCVLHGKGLIKKYGWWKDRQEAGYAHDWEFFSRWVNGKEPWTATKTPTLIYNVETCGQREYLKKRARLVSNGKKG